jgi:hypothetical protein
MKGLDPESLVDPKDTDAAIAAASDATNYGYTATPANCDNAAAASMCSAYVLTATLESGGTYVKQSN